jgi:hypothetical protein
MSTLQRRLADHDTTFTEVRQRVQIEVALELLTKGKGGRRQRGMSQQRPPLRARSPSD